MIIYTVNDLRIYETRSDKPNEDWTGKAEFIVDEANPGKKELISKIKKYAPYFDFVTDTEGNLIDVTKTGEMVYEIPVDPIEILQSQNKELQSQNKELQAKTKALTESNQMLEECLVEMAEIVYA